MKKIFEKFMLILFALLCIFAVFATADEISRFISSFYNQDSDYYTISCFFIEILIIGYAINYFESKSNKENSIEKKKYYDSLIGLDNIRKLNTENLNTIAKMAISPFYDVDITLHNGLKFSLSIDTFSNIKNSQDLKILDLFINEYLKENPNTSSEIAFTYQFKNEVVNFITSLSNQKH